MFSWLVHVNKELVTVSAHLKTIAVKLLKKAVYAKLFLRKLQESYKKPLTLLVEFENLRAQLQRSEDFVGLCSWVCVGI